MKKKGVSTKCFMLKNLNLNEFFSEFRFVKTEENNMTNTSEREKPVSLIGNLPQMQLNE